jgi:hypothetical protein
MSMIQIPVALRGAGHASFVAKDGGGLTRTYKGQAVSPPLATVIGCSREAQPLEPALVPINWANASFLREPRGVLPEASLSRKHAKQFFKKLELSGTLSSTPSRQDQQ